MDQLLSSVVVTLLSPSKEDHPQRHKPVLLLVNDVCRGVCQEQRELRLECSGRIAAIDNDTEEKRMEDNLESSR